MASVRRRGKTWSYRYSVVIDDAKGERKYKTVEKGGFKTKAEALEAGQLAEQGQKYGYKTYNLRECSFGQILDEWEEDTRYLYKKTTQRSHRKEVKLIKEYLGDMNVQQISLNVLNTFIRQMIERGHTRHRLMSIKGTLSQAMKYAYISGYIIRNPAAELKLPTARASAEAGMEGTVSAREIVDKITKDDGCTIKYINGSWNMFNCITYVLESEDYKLPSDLTSESIFCYVYNMDIPEYSLFTECSFRRRGNALVKQC